MKHIMNNKISLRLPALLLAFALLLSLLGCSSKSDTLAEREQLIEELYGSVELAGADQQTTNEATTSNFVLPYSRVDLINPYSCESSLNAVLTDLIYDQLITVTSEFEAEMVMAVQITQTGERQLAVTLRDGIVFSDGTPVTGRDIKYSFNAAKADGSRYKGQLSIFKGCSSLDEMVYFRLEEADPRAYMRLDFPIIKAESDTGTKVPIGSGRYTYISDPVRGVFLERNTKWYSSNASNVDRISLVSMPTIESIVHSVEIGTVSYYYTDLRSGYPSRINANFSTIDINNLVYLGINTLDDRLTQFEVREAISDAIGREEIITGAYGGRAYAATGPLTTSWPVAAEAQTGSTIADPAKAEALLEECGYLTLDEDYIRRTIEGQRLDFTILVNRENEQHIAVAERICEQLKSVGINAAVVSQEYAAYRQSVAAGDYTLYLGEYALYNNMDFSDLYTPNRGLYYGLTPQTTIDAYSSYKLGQSAISDVIDAFETELPFVPICYRLGMVCYSRSLAANMDVTESDFFLHMGLWDVALAEDDDGKSDSANKG